VFLDLDNYWPPQEPIRPGPERRPTLSKRRERVLLGVVGVNLLFVLAAPIAGVTFIDVVLALFK
jgi:hypothetical protein